MKTIKAVAILIGITGVMVSLFAGDYKTGVWALGYLVTWCLCVDGE